MSAARLTDEDKEIAQVRIISLGEIVTPNMAKGVEAIAKHILRHQKLLSGTGESKGIDIPLDEVKAMMQIVGKVAYRLNPEIERFKMGDLTEDRFDELFISELKKETGVELTPIEFNEDWNEMNPLFAVYANLLAEAIAYNKQLNQKMVFVSYSNPKDIRNLIKQLKEKGVPYQVDKDDNLIEIAGIEVHLSYVKRQPKSGLIAGVVSGLKEPRKLSSLATLSVLGSATKMESKEADIKYIYGTNKIKDEFAAQKAAFEKDSQAAKEAAENLRVETILWDKQQTSFKDILTNRSVFSCVRLISAL